MHDDLVKRLRRSADMFHPGSEPEVALRVAADTIEALVLARDGARQNCTLAIQANDLLCVRTNKAEADAARWEAVAESRVSAEELDQWRAACLKAVCEKEQAEARADQLAAEVDWLTGERDEALARAGIWQDAYRLLEAEKGTP